jgi:hypothetical protein
MTAAGQELLLRSPSEAWIDAIESVLNAQKDFYINGLRRWQRLSLGAFASQAAAVEGSADATKAAVDGAADAAASTSQAAEASGESLSRTLTEQTRRTRTQPESSASVVLEALTVEQLDRVADANNVDNYPHSGAKRDKVDALAAAKLDLEDLSVEHLDRLAAATDVPDYPKSASKSDKITALEAANVHLGS